MAYFPGWGFFRLTKNNNMLYVKLSLDEGDVYFGNVLYPKISHQRHSGFTQIYTFMIDEFLRETKLRKKQ